LKNYHYQVSGYPGFSCLVNNLMDLAY